MLGVFGKLPGTEPVKTRLLGRLDRAEVERLYLASLADTIETACRVVERPVLFLPEAAPSRDRAADALLGAGLDPEAWRRVQLERQFGDDLGARLENAFRTLCTGDDARAGALVVGSDSPSVGEERIRAALAFLPSADVVLGPTADGGYYAIGLRRPEPGLLAGIAWSTERVLEQTVAQARARKLRVRLLEPWTDVDRPEDLAVLAAQIAARRAAGDLLTARHTAVVLALLAIEPRPDSTERPTREA